MGMTSSIQNLLFGRPLATSEERAEHIGPIAGIPIFGLDALSSAAYGPLSTSATAKPSTPILKAAAHIP